MNKSRRMAALQARALSEAGISVLQIDLMGCGDSAGDFGDATWPIWVADVVRGGSVASRAHGLRPASFGDCGPAACLRVAAAATLESAPDLVFWQPVISGRQHLQQFLRLRVAGELIGRAGADRTGTDRASREARRRRDTRHRRLCARPRRGALGLDAADLAPLPTRIRVAWFEVSSSEPPEMSPAGANAGEAWQAAGSDVSASAVAGLPFWQTQEIAECAPLIDATTAVVRRWHPS